MIQKDKKKVILGMSGGVDSAVAAKLLVDSGYTVIGVTLKLWEPDGPVENRRWQERTCCKVGLAKFAAGQLEIEHRTVDVRDAFQSDVIEPFCNRYMLGETPNPCIDCNETIKFKYLASIAAELGAGYIATGHYAEIVKSRSGEFFIQCGEDKAKDQSYFLYRLPKELLPKLIFPLGHHNKNEVWNISTLLGLPPEEVSESQEICFVTQKDYRGFLQESLKDKLQAQPKGDFRDRNGKLLGRHNGICNYTIGQRRGLGIAAGERLYVIEINPKTNTVVLGTKADLLVSGLIAENTNLFTQIPEKVEAKIRYRSTLLPATASITNNNGKCRLKLLFDSPVAGVTPGQSVVLYKNNLMLGGGVIVRALP